MICGSLFARAAAREMRIPTMAGKESAGMARVKAAIITTQTERSP